MIMTEFNVSRYQAGKDIKAYSEIAIGNLKPYEAADKSYKPSNSFNPYFIKDNEVELINDKEFELDTAFSSIVPKLQNCTIIGVVNKILLALDLEEDIEALYGSSNNPIGRKRKLHPIGLIYAGENILIRAYCYQDKDFKNFKASRFLTIPKSFKCKKKLPVDIKWVERIEIGIEANPYLKEEGISLINKQYNLKNRSNVWIRKAIVGYYLNNNNIPVSENEMGIAVNEPWKYPVMIKNHFFEKVKEAIR
jgi:hypothetical protein